MKFTPLRFQASLAAGGIALMASENPVLSAYFLVIPIMCLYGVSYYKIMTYLQTYFFFDIKVLSFLVITFSYAITITFIYILSEAEQLELLKKGKMLYNRTNVWYNENRVNNRPYAIMIIGGY